MASTVTLDRAYFETLLRRSEFHISADAFVTPLDLVTVTILKSDHDNLLRLAQEYAALRNALFCGGITNEALEVLIRGGGSDPSPITQLNDTNPEMSQPTFDYQPPNMVAGGEGASMNPPMSHPAGDGPSRNTWGSGPTNDSHRRYDRQLSSNHDDTSFFSDLAVDGDQLLSPGVVKPHYAKSEQRTIIIKNLSGRATLRDIVEIVRGGLVLDLYLRPHEKTASVSFVEGTAATAFLHHLEFAWNDRQFILPGHVAGKIHTGATRNLVLRGVNPNITADRLRDDLDHIHNLVVIGVYFDHGDAFVSLNSIHNSLYARTCMMSRAVYKGMRIEWYPDECAQPLPHTPIIPKQAMKAAAAKKAPTTLNRFQMLNMDGSADGSSTEEDDTLSDFSTIHRRQDWNAEGVAV